ncbi:MAG TPA: hypothetical protein VLA73_11590 [Burkholderiales bacterium]|nr:hypothetical protein [Burkholderiales bacterium]
MELYQNWLALYVRCFAILGQTYCAWLQAFYYSKGPIRPAAPIRVVRVAPPAVRLVTRASSHQIAPSAPPISRLGHPPMHPTL